MSSSIGVAYLRHSGHTGASAARAFGPKTAVHPTCDFPCLACGLPMRAGQYTTLIALGPGPSEEARERAAAGRVYNAVAVEVHWTCATGKPEPTE